MERRTKIPALTTEQMREVDHLMVNEFGITLIQMMENAGRSLAELARRLNSGNVLGKSIIALCGTGNNGGGGMVAARHLHNMGAQVSVMLTADPNKLKEVPSHQWSILKRLQLDQVKFDLEASELILDAMLGYGAAGDPRPPIKDWIERANASGIPILSLDAPSGLDTTTGKPGRPCIQAETTMMLALPKTGLLALQARDLVGELYLADIGVPSELLQRIGIRVDPLFSNGPIIRFIDSSHNCNFEGC
ncbi:MAG: NAD(P)H-hydrate epimerase [Anaerolineae bacterium]|nr:NAD(P)H-hydrate epimerase [Anaerolineae bacterium]MCI0610095.1 NAD(P)H-hydrate epimerase [Anaerolineae bacterium]